MDTKTVVGVVLGIIVVGGGVWYALTHPIVGAPIAQEQTSAEAQNGSGTIAALWAMTGTLECTVTSSNESSPFSGVVYVSEGKVRADVTATIASMNNKEVESHMIRSDGFIYSWTNLVPQGVKIAESEATTPGTQSQGVSANTQVSYTCKPWVADTSKFAVPTNITFMAIPTAR